MAINAVQIPKKKLSGSGVTSTATSITLQDGFLSDGTTEITMADFGTIGFATLEPGTSRMEQISFTGITANADDTITLTGVTRGLRFVSPYDEVSANKKSHAGGTILIITNTAGFYDKFGIQANDETITGTWTFTSTAKAKYDANPTFSDEKELITKKYADDLAIAGAPDATTSVKGIVELATQAEVDAGTPTGGTGASLVATPAVTRGRQYHDYAADSVGTDSYAITISPAITAYVAGQVFVFKAGTANTGAATLAVSGLAAKTIKKNLSADLDTGDIQANQIVEVVYDGVNDVMQMVPTTLNHTHASTTTGGQLNATNVFSAGTVPTARLGSGSATSSTFLRGDQSWAAPVTSGILGTWATPTTGSAAQAATDAILVISAATDSSAFTVKTDAANPPTIVRGRFASAAATERGTVTVPVKKSDYYLIETSAGSIAAYIIPIGT